MRHGLDQEAPYDGPAFFSMGFRPFFLSAALFAGMAVPLWVLMFSGVKGGTVLYPPRLWHIHEMVFGFLPAVMMGFLLTAIPNWTDRPPIRGLELIGLWSLWLAGRLVIAMPWVDASLAAMVDGAFLVVAAGLVWREIAAAKSWRHAPMGVLISLYALANIAFHLLTVGERSADVPPRMALAVILVLLTVIGGRIIPNFTEEFFELRGRSQRPAPFSRYDGLAILLVVISGMVWVGWPFENVTGWLFVLAGIVNGGRLARWKGWLTWPEPLVLVLHVGYGWVVAALVLMGGSLLGIGLPPADALHALTAGAVGVMTLGVMTRASLGHTGRPRHAGPLTVGIYLMAFLGALIRVFGPAAGLTSHLAMGLAAASWSGAYLLFVLYYGPFLLRPSLDE
ncbi:MAG: NnrS family protein [Nitrospira sp.]|nr:NnrS family protein [Nitrospira sp.]MCP9442173.1 NnrS family protein [Nitrospira sp.]